MDNSGKYIPPHRRNDPVANTLRDVGLTTENIQRLGMSVAEPKIRDGDDSSLSDFSTISRATSKVSVLPSWHAETRMNERTTTTDMVKKAKMHGSLALNIHFRPEDEAQKVEQAIEVAQKWCSHIRSKWPSVCMESLTRNERARSPRIEVQLVKTDGLTRDIKHFLESEGFFKESRANRITYCLHTNPLPESEFTHLVVVEGGFDGPNGSSQVITVIRKKSDGEEAGMNSDEIDLINAHMLVSDILDEFRCVDENDWESAARYAVSAITHTSMYPSHIG